MPHDKNGTLVNVGAKVRVDFTVTQVYQGDDNYCNASLETVEPMFPGEHKTALTINTRQCEVISGEIAEGVELVSGDTEAAPA